MEREDFKNVQFSKEVIIQFEEARKMAENIGVYYISNAMLLVSNAIDPQSMYHKYLLRNELTEKEIKKHSRNFIMEYFENIDLSDIWYQSLVITVQYYQYDENGKIETVNGNLIFSLEDDLYNGLVEYFKEFENDEQPKIFTEELLLKILIQKFPDIYNGFMDICFGSRTKNIKIPAKLESYLGIMNDEMSKHKEKCPILGREKETEQLIKVLTKSKKRNAILIGEPGVGKTAIIEKLAWQIATGNCYEKFMNSQIISLDINSIIAGTMYRGMAEERFKDLISFLELNNDCILFIDEIHLLLGAGACKDGELDLANALKPILARGKVQVIGATTADEYKKYFSKDGALKRRFERIFVKEPKSYEVYDMIKNQISILEKEHGVTISKEMVDFAILNSSCFNFETKNPDRTLDLIDRSMSGAELKGHKEVEKADILENYDFRIQQFENTNKEDKLNVAYHEAGHYIVSRFAPLIKNEKILAISIMPAEDYNGINVFEIDEEIMNQNNYEYYIQVIAKLLAGRVAEEMYSKELAAGASEDLKRANKIAENMVTKFALIKGFSAQRIYCTEDTINLITEKDKKRIDKEIRKILKKANKYAKSLLKEHSKELELIVENLMEKGMINAKEIEEIFIN